jgi:hypothetical protein
VPQTQLHVVPLLPPPLLPERGDLMAPLPQALLSLGLAPPPGWEDQHPELLEEGGLAPVQYTYVEQPHLSWTSWKPGPCFSYLQSASWMSSF